jgi:hypothetical protein
MDFGLAKQSNKSPSVFRVREPSLTVGLLRRFAFRIPLVNSTGVFRVREPSLTVGLLPRFAFRIPLVNSTGVFRVREPS